MMFFKVLLYDIKITINNKKYIFTTLFFALTACLFFDNEIRAFPPSKLLTYSGNVSVFEYFAYILKGMDVYSFNLSHAFLMPTLWVLFHMIYLFQVGQYPTENLNGFGKQIILKINNKKLWFFSKCAWLLFSAVFYYLLLACGIIIYRLLKGKLVFFKFSDLSLHLFSVDLRLFSNVQIILWLTIIPILVLFCLGLLQMIISINIATIFGTLISFALIISSAYFYLPIFIGNYAMLKRTNTVIGGFVNLPNAFIIISIYILILIICGVCLFNRKEFY